MQALLNVGLVQQDHANNLITPDEVLGWFKELGIPFNRHGVVMGKSGEPTMVIHSRDISDEDIHDACVGLGQQCIAVYDLEEARGKLVGPHADLWGSFNPKLFSVL